jgi:hypothetical protein
MTLIQILLPLRDNGGRRFEKSLYAKVRHELVERFGGLTAYARAPARGAWKAAGSTTHDDIMVLEVMAGKLDLKWWKAYRLKLERAFRQDQIVIRAQSIQVL